VTIYPDSVEPHFEHIESVLEAQREVSTESATPRVICTFSAAFAGIEDSDCLEAVAERLVGELSNDTFSLSRSLPFHSPTTLYSFPTPVSLKTQSRSNTTTSTNVNLRQCVPLLAAPVETELSQVDVGRRVSESDIRGGTEISEAGREDLLNVIATVSSDSRFANFDLSFLTDRLESTPYELYQLLSQVPGVDCEISDNGVIEFATVPAQVAGSSLQEEYTTHLVDRCAAVKRRMNVLSQSVSDGTVTCCY